ncbi:MAG: sensor histidine kinase [Opitutaceae bacterium]|nr:sensor histidine kinase [Opitutaceae bacterium]
MQPFTRPLVIALVLLLVFLAAALTAQAWLQRENRRLQTDAVAARRAQFVQALEITRRPAETWDEAFQHELGTLMGGTVTLHRGEPPLGNPPGPGLLGFDYRLPGGGDFTARVTFATPAASRLAILHERMLVAVILLALLLLLVSAGLALPRRFSGEGGSRSPWSATRAEMHGLEHFARISVERGEALERESGARLRAEEDLQLNRTLLGHSLEERVRLGRDLHDSICQTLYAVSLSLEGLRAKLGGGGSGETPQRLDQCIAELRRLNHEVRSYLKELEPGVVQRGPFLEALEAMLAAQPCTGGVHLARDLEPDAVARIAPERAPEVVNILREALSNSLRHGRARTITVHARHGDGCVIFAVQDDGVGFDPATAGPGHGLANMQARAAALGGSVSVVSARGKGTRVLLTLPVSSAS